VLQVLYINVAKVNRYAAHVVMAIHVCFKYFICFRQMLQVFCLYVAKVDLNIAYTCTSQVYV
jgi:hypothetical protein